MQSSTKATRPDAIMTLFHVRSAEVFGSKGGYLL